ncbi:tyrosine-type recombinase/integrase [Sutterella wadsworthensis]|uniref:tyrosine-type recombinase/integrase n=1 Tax=Sutterella wadsworthensis TaxID=40545 RepID=UPI00033BC396|nr:tyrosine-type recombinase/integrase [Sutterella wadsworthensis]CCZ16662.1 putative uncharacterized protein [Sutterella wadsworthensis CAG:135]
METHFEVVSPLPNEGGRSESRQNSLLQEPLDFSGDTVNAAAAYLAELHSGDSRRAVRSRLNIAARWLGAADAFSCEWGRLRYVHVLGFMHALADKEGLAAASVNAYLSALKGVAETAWRLRQIDLTTYAEIKAVKQLRVHREPTGRALQADESQKLLAAVDEDSGPKAVRDRALIALLLGCGLRRAEVTTLRMENLERSSGTLRVIGKGNKERKVFFTPEVAQKVNAWLDLRGTEPGGTEPGWLVGRLTKGGQLILTNPLDPASIGRVVKHAQDLAKIAPITTHDLRRTFATRLLAKNVDIVAVKNLMGHANVSTTAKYDRRSEEALQQAAQLAEL